MTFKALRVPYDTEETNIEFLFPEGVDEETHVVDFLARTNVPAAVVVFLGEEEYLLKNQASNTRSTPFYAAMTRVIQTPGNIYQYIDAKRQQGFDASHAPLLAYYQRYLKKQLATLPPDSTLTEEKRKQIMHSIMDNFRVDYRQTIYQLKAEELKNDIRIDELNKEISAFNDSLERKFSWYVKLTALISGVHIITFGYMIFFVDWLGWDIIEPLTYSLGLLGTMLAMRFWLKHKKERKLDVVRDIFKRLITRNTEQVWLEQKMRKRQFFLDERLRMRQRMDIYRMRADYGWFRQLTYAEDLPHSARSIADS